MKIFYIGKDGGAESRVWGFWLLEEKSLCSIAFLLFKGNSREAYHNHAFNSISWVIKGRLTETLLDGTINVYKPSLKPIFTYRDTFHKVDSTGNTVVFTLRGAWLRFWREYLPRKEKFVTLTNGRRVVGNG